MAKFLDQNGSKRLVDNLKTSRTALNTKINSEIVARENLATDVTSSIAALDTKLDDRIQTIAVDGSTLSITNGAGTTDTYNLQDTTYDVATTSTNGLMSASDKSKLDGIDTGAQVNSIEEFWVDGVKQTISAKKISLDLSGKVDKVSGKQLSTNDFTTAEKNKLASIENGAEANVIGSIKVDGTALTVTNKAVNINLSGKVDTVSGKQLSTNDFTTAEKNKLASIESGAEVNAIEEIFIDGTKQTVTDKKASLDLSGFAKKSDIAGVYKYKGSVNTFSALPTTAETGDVYNIKTAGGTDVFGTSIKAGDNVAFNGTGWDVLSGTIDLSGYVEKVSGKQLSSNDFTTAQKTKLDNLASITAAGDNITISGGKISGTAPYTLPAATASTLGGVKIGTGLSVNNGTVSLATATASSLGGIKVGTGLTNTNGTVSLAAATAVNLGGVKVGSGISVSSGIISVPTVTSSANGLMSSSDKKKLDNLASITAAGANITISGGTIKAADTTYNVATSSTNGLMSSTDKAKLDGLSNYELPTASTSTKGGVKIGNGLSMDGDTLNVTVSGVDNLDTWNAANLYLKPAVLGSVSSTVNGAIWFVSDSGATSGSSDVVIFGTTASALDGAVWFA